MPAGRANFRVLSGSPAASTVNAFEYLAMALIPHLVAVYCICSVAGQS